MADVLLEAGKERGAVKKIIIVEDDRDISDALVFTLSDILNEEKKTVEFDQVFNGKQALELLAIKKFDIMLLDLMMPIISGYDLLPEIQKDPAYKTMWIALISAVPNAYAFGLQKHVQVFKKPLNIKQLVDMIQAHPFHESLT